MGNEVCCSSRASAKFDLKKFKLQLGRSEEQLEEALGKEIEHLFAGADIDKNGALSHDEIEKLVQRMEGIGFEFPVAMRSFDFDRSGTIERPEFLAAMRTAIFERPHNLQQLLRNCQDVRGMTDQAWKHAAGTDHHLRVETASQLMAAISTELGEEDHAQVDNAAQVSTYDANKDGVLSRTEFNKMYIDFLCKKYYAPRNRSQSQSQ